MLVPSKVNGNIADSDPSLVIWTDDLDQHPVDLSATSAPCYDLDGSGAVDIGDFDVMGDFWRAADAAALVLYDFNNNGVVDVGDFVKLGMRLGEPSS